MNRKIDRPSIFSCELLLSGEYFKADYLITLVFSRSSIAGLEVSTPGLRYFSIIKFAIGAAQVAPNPPFSTNTAMAIFGLSLGENAI